MLTMRAGSKQLIREINQAIVLNTIRTHGVLSRTDIASISKLSLATISGITAELIESGFVYEREVGISTGGRPPVLLALNKRAGYVVGVKLTEDTVIAALTDLEATAVASHTAALVGQTPEAIVETLAATVEALRPAAGNRPVLGAGIGIAGVIDRQRKLVHYATYFGWRNIPVALLLEQRLHIPVVVDNDVNALTAAEQWFGTGSGINDFLVVSIGRGVGLGMVLDGHLYRGTAGGAGEFGHITVVPDGPYCECGKRGCLEALVSDPAVTRRVAAALGYPVDINTAIDLALHGDAIVQSIFAAAGRTLGMAVANLVNVLNPALIIIGGEGTRAGGLILDPLQDALREHCFDGLYDDMRVVTEPWGDEAWARGAASLLLGELFQPALRRGEEDRPSLAIRSPV
jgi:N-acetylglucosamine repressor